MAKPTPADAKADARNPNTLVDKVERLDPAEVDAVAFDPETYGVRTIDTEGAAEAYRAGDGAKDPVVMPAYNAPENSTFAQRAAARQKVVGTSTDTVTAK